MQSNSGEFQTPMAVAHYMAEMIPLKARWVYEPCSGSGNLSAAAASAGCNVIESENFFATDFNKRYDAIIMNPPFSARHMHGVPDDMREKGMRAGYWVLNKCMYMSNHVIALMPWFILLDSDVRLRKLMKFGLKSVTALPRKTFNYARIQTCVLELHRGYKGKTEYKVFDSYKL